MVSVDQWRECSAIVAVNKVSASFLKQSFVCCCVCSSVQFLRRRVPSDCIQKSIIEHKVSADWLLEFDNLVASVNYISAKSDWQIALKTRGKSLFSCCTESMLGCNIKE